MKTYESVIEGFIDNIEQAKKTGVVGRYTIDEIKRIQDYCSKADCNGTFNSYFQDGFKKGNSKGIYLDLSVLEVWPERLDDFMKAVRERLYKDFNDNYYL